MMRRLAALAAALAVLALAPSAQAATRSWTTELSPLPAGIGEPPYLDNAVSCASASFCVQFTSGQDRTRGVVPVAIVRRGSELTAQELPLPIDAEQPTPTISLSGGIDCVSPTECVAVGGYPNYHGLDRPLIETYSKGRWVAGAAPGAGPYRYDLSLSQVACNATQCVATGSYYNSATEQNSYYLAVRDSAGTWSQADVVGGGILTTVSNPVCPPDGSCYAQAYDETSSTPSRLIYPSTDGWRQSPFPAPPGANLQTLTVGQLSCPTDGYCVGIGAYRDAATNQNHLAREQVINGWQVAHEIRIPTADRTRTDDLLPGPTSCGGAPVGVPCAAAATFSPYGNPGTPSLLVSSSGSTWRAVRPPVPAGGQRGSVSLRAISCSASGTCAAVGTYLVAGKPMPVAENKNPTGWVATGLGVPPGGTDPGAELDGISCAGAQCMASGRTLPAPSGGDPNHGHVSYALYG